MAITLDPTTEASYLALSDGAQRASHVISTLTAPVTVEIVDGSNVIRASGTMGVPWATSNGTSITIGQTDASQITVSSGGTPDGSWYAQFKGANGRYVRGGFGLVGSGRDFTWSKSSFQTGDKGAIGIAGVSSTGPSAPVNTALPVISGTPQVGQTLSSSTGSWSNSPTAYVYQWLRAGSPISGATSSTYVLQAADQGALISVQVIAANGGGSVAVTSGTVGPVAAALAAPVNTALPVVTGSTVVGQVLSVTSGTWTGNPTPTYAYQWLRDGVAISGAIQTTYTLVLADAGAQISCRVTATNAVTSTVATSATRGPVTGAVAGQVDAGNTMSIATASGTQTNYPMQFGRVFRQGRIPNVPQVLLDGSAIASQADVKNRWPDGSVKFAVISVVIPTLGTTARTLGFQDVSSLSSTPESVANMLANYDFGAAINTTIGSASARTMLSALSDSTLAANTAAASPNSRYWTQGPVCTTVILADHTTKAYDFGSDANKALRPMFHVQFWPSIGRYRVRYVLEASDTAKLKDETYNVTLTIGNASPASQYTQSAVPHRLGTAWTKRFWSAARTEINCDPNFPYLQETRWLPNYDRTMSYLGLTADLTSWANAAKTLYSSNGHTQSQGGTGGAPEIGLIPGYYMGFVYGAGAAASWDLLMGRADMAFAYPLRFRCGIAQRSGVTRYYDDQNLVASIGRLASRDAYRTNSMRDGASAINAQASSADLFTIIGSRAANSWSQEGAHFGDPNFLPYIMTGDYAYLEQSQAWAHWTTFQLYPGTASYESGRDPRDCIGDTGQVRAFGWQMRNRGTCRAICPDNSPERAYWTRIFANHFKKEQGWLGATGYASDPISLYWFQNRPSRYTSNPLSFIHYSSNREGLGVNGYDDVAPFMVLFCTASAWWLTSMGEPVPSWYNTTIDDWWKKLHDYDWRYTMNYRIPATSGTSDANQQFYQTWASAFPVGYNVTIDGPGEIVYAHGYARYAAGTFSVGKDIGLPGATAIFANVSTKTFVDGDKWFPIDTVGSGSTAQNPLWAIAPR